MNALARRVGRLEVALPPPPPPPIWSGYDSYRDAPDPGRLDPMFAAVALATPVPPPSWRTMDPDDDPALPLLASPLFRGWVEARLARLDAVLTAHGAGVVERFERGDDLAADVGADVAAELTADVAAELSHLFHERSPAECMGTLESQEHVDWLAEHGYCPPRYSPDYFASL